MTPIRVPPDEIRCEESFEGVSDRDARGRQRRTGGREIHQERTNEHSGPDPRSKK